MRWLAIANPAAGRRHDTERLLERLLHASDLSVEFVHTSSPGDATRLARESSAFDGVIAIGGDGTVAEVLQGLDLARQHLAVLPAGHGNCLARDLGVSNPERALAALKRGIARPLDLMAVTVGYSDGREDHRLCASTLAVGYVTEVVKFGRQRLHWMGQGAYAAAAMIVVPSGFDARLSGADDPQRPLYCTGLVINNTAHLANFRGFPDASVRDGVIEVMEQGWCWPRQMLHNLSVLAGSRAFGPRRMRQVRAERLELLEARTLMADGELLHGVSHVHAECMPAAAMCIVGMV